MVVFNEQVKKIKAIWEGHLDRNLGGNLLGDIGIVRYTPMKTKEEMIFRVSDIAGGLLSWREKGESIKTEDVGFSMDEEKTKFYEFEGGKETLASKFMGTQDSQRSLSPEAEVKMENYRALHYLTLFGTELPNHLNKFASLGVLGKIDIKGRVLDITGDNRIHTYFDGTHGGANLEAGQLDISSVALKDWQEVSTATPLRDLFDIQANYFGKNRSIQGMTVLMRQHVFNAMLRSDEVIRTLADRRGNVVAAGELPAIAIEGDLRSYLTASRIQIIIWEDYIFEKAINKIDDKPFHFCPEGEIITIPTELFYRDFLGNQTKVVGAGSNVPLIEIFYAPSPDFSLLDNGARYAFGQYNQAIPFDGLYAFSGIVQDLVGRSPNKLITTLASSMAIYVNPNYRIKRIKTMNII